MSGSKDKKPTGGSAMAGHLQDALIDSSLSHIRHKLIVMSGKGGVGKSSVAVNLAVGLAERGFGVGLMDVDLHGPSVAQMTGVSGPLEVTPDRFAVPKRFGEHLKIVSMQSLIQDRDQAVIWRGPAKAGVIRQFIADVQWGDLDFLLIDSPPGTGDEPLTVAQTVKGARALIVTTPQEVALLDVRKSINFCRAVDLPIAGLIENMGPFSCPCCGKTVEVFKSGGGRATAREMGIPFLGSLPFDPEVVKTCDAGTPIMADATARPYGQALQGCIDHLLELL